MKIIGVVGRKRSGKDTIGEYLVRKYGYTRMSFADPLKEAASIMLNRQLSECHGVGYDREQIMPEWGFCLREFLQKLGTDFARNMFCDDFWIRRNRMELSGVPDVAKLVFTDVRFLNEAAHIRSHGGLIVRVVRDATESTDTHRSEVEMSSIRHDYVVLNNAGYDELFVTIDSILRFRGLM